MKSLIKTSVATFVMLGLAACNSTPSYEKADVSWVNEKSQSFQPATEADLPPNTTNIVFYRAKDGLPKESSVNIGINNRYRTSLHGGNYTSVVSCAGGTTISTAVTKKLLNNLKYNENVFDFQPGQNIYFEVSVDSAGNSKASKVAEDVAIEKLGNKRLQTHMVNRVVPKNCMPAKPRQKDPVPVQKEEKLFGVYYFDFNIPKMNAAETQRAFNLGTKIKNTGRDYTVYLSGHADPVGADGYNQSLSKKRAINVAQTLEKAGVDPSKIKLGSFGEKQPVMLECDGKKVKSTRNGCNLKNRRVEVLVKLGDKL